MISASVGLFPFGTHTHALVMAGRIAVVVLLAAVFVGALGLASAKDCFEPDEVMKEGEDMVICQKDEAQPQNAMSTSLYVKPGGDFKAVCVKVENETLGKEEDACLSVRACNLSSTMWHLMEVKAKVLGGESSPPFKVKFNLTFDGCFKTKDIAYKSDNITCLTVTADGKSEWLLNGTANPCPNTIMERSSSESPSTSDTTANSSTGFPSTSDTTANSSTGSPSTSDTTANSSTGSPSTSDTTANSSTGSPSTSDTTANSSTGSPSTSDTTANSSTGSPSTSDTTMESPSTGSPSTSNSTMESPSTGSPSKAVLTVVIMAIVAAVVVTAVVIWKRQRRTPQTVLRSIQSTGRRGVGTRDSGQVVENSLCEPLPGPVTPAASQEQPGTVQVIENSLCEPLPGPMTPAASQEP